MLVPETLRKQAKARAVADTMLSTIEGPELREAFVALPYNQRLWTTS
jgi:hypothetical protein